MGTPWPASLWLMPNRSELCRCTRTIRVRHGLRSQIDPDSIRKQHNRPVMAAAAPGGRAGNLARETLTSCPTRQLTGCRTRPGDLHELADAALTNYRTRPWQRQHCAAARATLTTQSGNLRDLSDATLDELQDASMTAAALLHKCTGRPRVRRNKLPSS